MLDVAHAFALVSLIALGVWVVLTVTRTRALLALLRIARVLTYVALAGASLCIFLLPTQGNPKEVRPCYVVLGFPLCLALAWLSIRIDR